MSTLILGLMDCQDWRPQLWLRQQKKILDVLESATRGLRRQVPPLNEIADMPTLVLVVQGLEGIVNGSHPSAV